MLSVRIQNNGSLPVKLLNHFHPYKNHFRFEKKYAASNKKIKEAMHPIALITPHAIEGWITLLPGESLSVPIDASGEFKTPGEYRAAVTYYRSRILLYPPTGKPYYTDQYTWTSNEIDMVILGTPKEEQVEDKQSPEERGEDLSVLETTEVVKRLAESKEKIELRKAAKVLGDRSITQKLDLTIEEKQVIENVVSGYLKQARSTNANERTEARQQIERLWHVAAPTLLKNLSNPTTAEMTIKSLILMRSEAIIKAIIEKAKTAQDEHTKAMAVFALKKMKEQRKSLIPGRECLNEEQSRILYNRLVAPALRNLEEEINP